MGTAATQLDEETLIREVIAGTALPAGVKFKRVEHTKDWTGDPSIRIYFSVAKTRPKTPKYIRELTQMTTTLQQNILSLGLEKFPFPILEDAR